MNYYLTKEARTQSAAKTVSKYMVLKKVDWYVQKNETIPPTYTIHKNKLKMDRRLKYKLKNNKYPRRIT